MKSHVNSSDDDVKKFLVESSNNVFDAESHLASSINIIENSNSIITMTMDSVEATLKSLCSIGKVSSYQSRDPLTVSRPYMIEPFIMLNLEPILSSTSNSTQNASFPHHTHSPIDMAQTFNAMLTPFNDNSLSLIEVDNFGTRSNQSTIQICNLKAPIKVFTEQRVQRNVVGELQLVERIDVVGDGVDRDAGNLVKLQPAIDIIGIEPVPLLCSLHDVYLGYGQVLIKRMTQLIQNPNRGNCRQNAASHVESYVFRSDLQNVSNKINATAPQVEIIPDSKYGFFGPLKITTRREIQRLHNGDYCIKDVITIQLVQTSNQPVPSNAIVETVEVFLKDRKFIESDANRTKVSESVKLRDGLLIITKILEITAFNGTNVKRRQISLIANPWVRTGTFLRNTPGSMATPPPPSQPHSTVADGVAHTNNSVDAALLSILSNSANAQSIDVLAIANHVSMQAMDNVELTLKAYRNYGRLITVQERSTLIVPRLNARNVQLAQSQFSLNTAVNKMSSKTASSTRTAEEISPLPTARSQFTPPTSRNISPEPLTAMNRSPVNLSPGLAIQTAIEQGAFTTSDVRQYQTFIKGSQNSDPNVSTARPMLTGDDTSAQGSASKTTPSSSAHQLSPLTKSSDQVQKLTPAEQWAHVKPGPGPRIVPATVKKSASNTHLHTARERNSTPVAQGNCLVPNKQSSDQIWNDLVTASKADGVPVRGKSPGLASPPLRDNSPVNTCRPLEKTVSETNIHTAVLRSPQVFDPVQSYGMTTLPVQGSNNGNTGRDLSICEQSGPNVINTAPTSPMRGAIVTGRGLSARETLDSVHEHSPMPQICGTPDALSGRGLSAREVPQARTPSKISSKVHTAKNASFIDGTERNCLRTGSKSLTRSGCEQSTRTLQKKTARNSCKQLDHDSHFSRATDSSTHTPLSPQKNLEALIRTDKKTQNSYSSKSAARTPTSKKVSTSRFVRKSKLSFDCPTVSATKIHKKNSQSNVVNEKSLSVRSGKDLSISKKKKLKVIDKKGTRHRQKMKCLKRQSRSQSTTGSTSSSEAKPSTTKLSSSTSLSQRSSGFPTAREPTSPAFPSSPSSTLDSSQVVSPNLSKLRINDSFHTARSESQHTIPTTKLPQLVGPKNDAIRKVSQPIVQVSLDNPISSNASISALSPIPSISINSRNPRVSVATSGTSGYPAVDGQQIKGVKNFQAQSPKQSQAGGTSRGLVINNGIPTNRSSASHSFSDVQPGNARSQSPAKSFGSNPLTGLGQSPSLKQNHSSVVKSSAMPAGIQSPVSKLHQSDVLKSSQLLLPQEQSTTTAILDTSNQSIVMKQESQVKDMMKTSERLSSFSTAKSPGPVTEKTLQLNKNVQSSIDNIRVGLAPSAYHALALYEATPLNSSASSVTDKKSAAKKKSNVSDIPSKTLFKSPELNAPLNSQGLSNAKPQSPTYKTKVSNLSRLSGIKTAHSPNLQTARSLAPQTISDARVYPPNASGVVTANSPARNTVSETRRQSISNARSGSGSAYPASIDGQSSNLQANHDASHHTARSPSQLSSGYPTARSPDYDVKKYIDTVISPAWKLAIGPFLDVSTRPSTNDNESSEQPTHTANCPGNASSVISEHRISPNLNLDPSKSLFGQSAPPARSIQSDGIPLCDVDKPTPQSNGALTSVPPLQKPDRRCQTPRSGHTQSQILLTGVSPGNSQRSSGLPTAMSPGYSSGADMKTEDLFPTLDPSTVQARNVLSVKTPPGQTPPQSPYVGALPSRAPVSTKAPPTNKPSSPSTVTCLSPLVASTKLSEQVALNPGTQRLVENPTLLPDAHNGVGIDRVSVESSDENESVGSSLSVTIDNSHIDPTNGQRRRRMRPKRIMLNGEEIWKKPQQ